MDDYFLVLPCLSLSFLCATAGAKLVMYYIVCKIDNGYSAYVRIFSINVVWFPFLLFEGTSDCLFIVTCYQTIVCMHSATERTKWRVCDTLLHRGVEGLIR